MKEFSKVAGYKINIQKLFVFLYINKSCLKIVTFIIVSKNNKILRNKIVRGQKHNTPSNYMTLMKEIGEDTNGMIPIFTEWKN